MKVLWIVNIIFPYPAQQLGIAQSVFGGWLNGLAMKLRNEKNIELSIATIYKGKKIKKFKNENITYYLLPGKQTVKYSKKLEDYWQFVNKDFQPELAHIHRNRI